MSNNPKPTGKSLSEQLKRYEQAVPRYLFRAFSARSGGGFRGSNTATSFTPLSFLCGRGHERLDSIGNLKEVLYAHLSYAEYPLTEFTSLTPGILLALSICQSRYLHGEPDVSLTILDTAGLNPGASIYPHLAFEELGLLKNQGAEMDTFLEYLAHGPITAAQPGSIVTVRFDNLKEHVHSLIPELSHRPGQCLDTYSFKLREHLFYRHKCNNQHHDSIPMATSINTAERIAHTFLGGYADIRFDMQYFISASLLNRRPRPWGHFSPGRLSLSLSGCDTVKVYTRLHRCGESVPTQWSLEHEKMMDWDNIYDVNGEALDFHKVTKADIADQAKWECELIELEQTLHLLEAGRKYQCPSCPKRQLE
jgi:hypothetical protein